MDDSSKPTELYRQLKNPSKKKKALKWAIRDAYAPLFEADENANALESEPLKGLISQVAGTDDVMTGRILGTFNALKKLADWSAENGAEEQEEEKDNSDEQENSEEQSQGQGRSAAKGIRPEFHYNFQIHLPSNGTEETYLNIFNALRRVFK